jgi:hypothetical protein
MIAGPQRCVILYDAVPHFEARGTIQILVAFRTSFLFDKNTSFFIALLLRSSVVGETFALKNNQYTVMDSDG